MANSPVMIKDYHNIVSSTRKDLLDEEHDKIIGTKGFVFSNYKTEKQRVEEYMEQKNTIYNRSNIQQLSAYVDPKDKATIIQPTMRFRARTDLERIYETVNNYSYGRVDKDIVNKQLRSLDLNVSRRREEEMDPDRDYPVDYTVSKRLKKKQEGETKKQQDIRERIDFKQKESKSKIKRKFVDNSEAKQLMSELHNKTHFKAATGFVLFSNRTMVDFRTKNNIEQQDENDLFMQTANNG